MKLSSNTADFIVIGAGVIGLTIAKELKKRHPDSHIIILEKEVREGEHASGRNSGVLHAGFYYTKDSLKAKFTKQGNAALTDYCLQKQIPINRCGKLVVARNEHDLSGLYELLERGKQNDIELQLISATDAEKIEPRAKTFEKALFSPTTSSVDPRHVLHHLLEDARDEGIHIEFETKYIRHTNNRTYIIHTNKQKYHCRYLINTAGLYADKIARDFGFSEHYSILPFKGLYLYASDPSEKLNVHVYPVPALENPFLGVHFTVNVNGVLKIGPTAIPAFWREQYQGFESLNYRELSEIVFREIGLFLRAGFDFRKLAWNEIKKYNRKTLVKHANELVQNVNVKQYQKWGKPGIRAQLLNTKTRKLEMDFITEGDDRSFHVLNAVSPAFTCSIPFARFTVDQIQRLIK